jgi:dTMP kinase
MPGKFIVFEGVEGSGKTTQLKLLRQWLEEAGWARQLQTLLPNQPQPILVTREPGGTPLGQKLRQLILHPENDEDLLVDRAELMLYAADRSQHVNTVLQPQLFAGGWVLCDRYTDSTVAYQGYGRGIDLETINQLNAIATAGLTPDLTLWLDVDPAVGLARARQRGQQQAQSLDRIEANDLAFHQRVQQGFATLASQHPERIVAIQAEDHPPAIASKIQEIVSHRITQWYPQFSTPQG